MHELESTGLQAVDAFITTFNSRDAARWADTLHFPHVRPSPFGPVNIADTKQTYIDAVDYARIIDTGWDHSEWDYKRFLHGSPNKLHVAGQWSRYNASGEKILSTPIVYIVTRLDGEWGIQSRFGCDFAADDDVTGFESRVFRFYETFVSHYNQGNLESCAEMLNYPHFRVDPANLNPITSGEDFKKGANHIEVDSLMSVQTGKKSANLAVELTLNHKEIRQGIININERDGHLGIQAISLLNPNEQSEES